MKCLVLGGSGFIGSHIVGDLLLAGHDVRVMTRSNDHHTHGPVDYIRGNLADTAELAAALTGIDTVIHCATATVPGTAALDQDGDVKGNLLPTIKLLDLMVKMDISKLLYMSSGGTVYGIPDVIPTPEHHPLNPINSYGIVKAACESYIRIYQRNHGIEAKIIRASNPYGPGQISNRAQGFITAAMGNILKGQPVQIWGDGSVVRDYIYVNDLAQLCVGALSDGISGTFNAGSGTGISLNALLDEMREVIGYDFEVNYSYGRNIDVPVSILDMTKASRELDYTPRFTLRQGLELQWEWLSSLSH